MRTPTCSSSPSSSRPGTRSGTGTSACARRALPGRADDGPASARDGAAVTGGVVVAGSRSGTATRCTTPPSSRWDGATAARLPQGAPVRLRGGGVRAGDSASSSSSTDGLRVGVMICFDWIFPETARVLALEGADVHRASQQPRAAVVPARDADPRPRERGLHGDRESRGEGGRAPRPHARLHGGSVSSRPRGEVLARRRGRAPAVLSPTWTVARARDKTLASGNDRLRERRPRLRKAPRRPDAHLALATPGPDVRKRLGRAAWRSCRP